MEIKNIQVTNHAFMQDITRFFTQEGKESITFVVRGNSMRPFLENKRDKVVLVPPCRPKTGDVVLAKIGKERYALHRVITIKGETFTMQGDGNPTWMKETFTEADIIGIAKAFIRKGRRVETDSFQWKFYSVTWKILKPARRILLAIYRRL